MTDNKNVAVSFENVDIIFGSAQKQALELLDQNANRETILEQTDAVLGVANASIDIEVGELCVLMGLSGSGKSTLLRAVNGLNSVTRGRVLIQHDNTQVDIASCSEPVLRELRMNRIAMVFQQFALLPWRTVEENVGLGLELKGLSAAQRKPIVEEKLKLVELYPWKDKYAHELSGGMQQRVGLARAFATDADILLMDEPFSALDPLIRNHLQDFLLDLQREFKKTIIFVSHDLDEALKLGNHIAIMEGGRIVQYGEPEDIVLNPANDYVAEFVAHMNPLNVLTGASFMRPIDELKRDHDTIELDSKGHYRLRLNQAKEIISCSHFEHDCPTQNYLSDTDVSQLKPENLTCVDVDVSMRTNIEIMQQTGCPVLLMQDKQLVGVVNHEEIYRGILRQSAKPTGG